MIRRLWLPGNPRPKERPRVYSRVAVTPFATLKAEASIKHAWRREHRGAKPFAGPVALRVRFARASALPCDLDNLVKLVADALNGLAWVDDRQIVALRAGKVVDRDEPGTMIVVREVGE